MDWARILAFVTGMVDQDLLAGNEYLAAENRILKALGTSTWRSRARDRASARQDRSTHRGTRFFSQEVRKMNAPDRRQLVDRKHGGLPVRRQCELLAIARSGVYRPPPAANDNDNDLALMRRINELFTAWPFPGGIRTEAVPQVTYSTPKSRA